MKDIMEDVSPELYFITSDGKKIKNLYQLHKSILTMDDEIFSHHVTSDRNDFYNWVKDVYRDQNLANALLNCTTRYECAGKIKDKLNYVVTKKKQHDARKILEQAKQEVKEREEEKKEAKAREEERVRVVSIKKAQKKSEPVKVTEKNVFVNNPPRAVVASTRKFTKEEKPLEINKPFMKASMVDFIFGLLIGVIAILILKQLL